MSDYKLVKESLQRFGRAGRTPCNFSRNFECALESGEKTERTVHRVMKDALRHPTGSLAAGVRLMQDGRLTQGRWMDSYEHIEGILI